MYNEIMVLEVVNDRGVALQYTYVFPSDYEEDDIRMEFANTENAVYYTIKNRYVQNPPSPVIDFGNTVIDLTTIISARIYRSMT